ncbi:MAG: hypothetical protein K2Y29_00385 [Beijerinckiaceae bacterium]|nr:hypothetical protein [Beijerinckiaceae bacterium]
MKVYGSNASPVSLDPFQTIVGVGWPARATYLAIPFALTNILASAQEPDTGSCTLPYTAPPGGGTSLLATYLKTITYSYSSESLETAYSASPALYKRTGTSGSWTSAGTTTPTGMPAAGQVKTPPAWSIAVTSAGLIRWQISAGEHPSGLTIPGSSIRKFASGATANVDHFGIPFTGPQACYYPDPDETTPDLGIKGAPYVFIDPEANPEAAISAGALQAFDFSGATVTYEGETYSVVGVGSDGEYSPILWLLLEGVSA